MIKTVLVLVVLALTVSSELLKPGTLAPRFALPDLNGQRVYLSTWAAPKLSKPYKNSVKHTIILSFWATYCAPCQKEIPELIAYKESHNDIPLKLFLINTETLTSAKLSTFVKNAGWKATILHDSYGRAGKNYGVEGLPSLVVINGDGKIIYSNKGFDPANGTIEEILDSVIFPKESQPTDSSLIDVDKEDTKIVEDTVKNTIEK